MFPVPKAFSKAVKMTPRVRAAFTPRQCSLAESRHYEQLAIGRSYTQSETPGRSSPRNSNLIVLAPHHFQFSRPLSRQGFRTSGRGIRRITPKFWTGVVADFLNRSSAF